MPPCKLMSILALIVMCACGRQATIPHGASSSTDDAGWRLVPPSEIDAAQQRQLDRAVSATDSMAKTMMGELKSELQAGGPPGAVAVCRDLAPMIAEHVGDEHGLTIGRTSKRLRNPTNLPPDWAADVVAGGTDRPAYFEGPAGELGVLLPIRLMPPCLACHGPAETLDADVRLALAESYPEDRAVGFVEGDLRGWFWVEVPRPDES